MSVFSRKNIINEIDDFMNFMVGDNYFLENLDEVEKNSEGQSALGNNRGTL